MISISNIPNKGRCFISQKFIPRGEILLIDSPYAVIPDCGAKSFVCGFCFRWDQNLIGGRGNPNTTRQIEHERNGESTRFEMVKCHGGCEKIMYCSVDCRDQDWDSCHRYECGFMASKSIFPKIKVDDSSLKEETEEDQKTLGDDGVENEKFGEYMVDYTWMLMRVLVNRFRELNSRNQTNVTTSENRSTFADYWKLCSNQSLFPVERIKEFENVAGVLYEFLIDWVFPTSDIHGKITAGQFFCGEIIDENDGVVERKETNLTRDSEGGDIRKEFTTMLVELICKEECNSFGLYTFDFKGFDVSRQGYALGVYPNAVFFNHSCQPNVGHVTRNSRFLEALREDGFGTIGKDVKPEMVFYAVRDIEPGEELTITYMELSPPGGVNVDVLENLRKRRENLKEVFFFECDCRRCKEESRGVNTFDLVVLECQKGKCKGWFVPKKLARVKTVAEGSWVCEGCGRTR
ncbi:hypothetical protein HK098_004164 [Nowakowskiella sp. JEL0407]|nr:hypothetical protein HK098_004164 [Nowakowskiella sp. JEL0407]